MRMREDQIYHHLSIWGAEIGHISFIRTKVKPAKPKMSHPLSVIFAIRYNVHLLSLLPSYFPPLHFFWKKSTIPFSCSASTATFISWKLSFYLLTLIKPAKICGVYSSQFLLQSIVFPSEFSVMLVESPVLILVKHLFLNPDYSHINIF